MIQVDTELAEVLAGHREGRVVASAFYGPNLTIEDVPLDSSGSVRWNGAAQIQATSTARVVSSDESRVPRAKTDPLAPYGQELGLTYRIISGGREWDVPLGRFRITDVPSMEEFFQRWPSLLGVIGWECELDLADRFEALLADDFLWPTSPKPGATVWAEIRALCPFPVVESLPDVPVPTSIAAYPDDDGSRAEAIRMLAAALGGVPFWTRTGALSVRRKDRWLTDTIPDVEIVGVVSVSDAMSNKLYNAVRVWSSAGNNDLVAVREITDAGDPLSVNGPLGRRVYKLASPILATQAAVDAAAVTALARVSSRQSRTAKVRCLPDPRIEVGDYVRARDEVSGRVVDGEVTSVDIPFDGTELMTLDLIVAVTA